MARCGVCHATKGLLGVCSNPECPSKRRLKRVKRTDEVNGTNLSHKARAARAAAQKRRQEKGKGQG